MKTDIQIAKELAIDAGKILLDIQNNNNLSPKKLGDIGDKTSNDFIINALRKYRPDDFILSEEEKDNKIRIGKERVWIIDPLDGTREYSNNKTDWAVHIALAINGKPKVGAVSIPANNKIYTSAELSKLPETNTPIKIVVSRSRTPQITETIANKLDAEIIKMGSAGVKAMAILKGDADIYLHSGGQYEWDNCAPFAVCIAQGLHCSRLDGSEIIYNQNNTFINDLLICKKELAPKILSLL